MRRLEPSPKSAASRRLRRSAMVALLALLGACHRSAPGADAGQLLGDADTEKAELSYAWPPQVLGAMVRGNGVVVLTGRAAPGATLRLSAPEGEVLDVKVRRTGQWTLRMQRVAAPRMFALSAWMGPRVVHGEGALLLAPAPGPAALLARAGSGALVIDRFAGAPTIAAADCDPGGFCAISGLARPGAAVRLVLDGAPSGAGQADQAGRYAVMAASRRLPLGLHEAMLQTPDGAVRRRFTLAPPGPLRRPYQASPAADGWRVEWATPGGGVQTTLVFAQAGGRG